MPKWRDCDKTQGRIATRFFEKFPLPIWEGGINRKFNSSSVIN